MKNRRNPFGVPAVFFNAVPYQLHKFLDWYYSTGRTKVSMVNTLEDALLIAPMPLPDLKDMRKALIEVFPVDLWE